MAQITKTKDRETMKRREQIIDFAENTLKLEKESPEWMKFIQGATWADAHPDLYSVTRKAVEREREYMIDKFCEFMQSCEGYVVCGEKCNYDNFIKFMEEQQ